MGSYLQIQCCSNDSMFVVSSFSNEDYQLQTKPRSSIWGTTLTRRNQFKLKSWSETENVNGSSKGKTKRIVYDDGFLFPIDPWARNVDSSVIASQLSAFSLLPYLGFLYFITKSKSAPKLVLFGFYFLLAFVVAATKMYYVTSLSNVDWLHGGAESLLMLTNLFIVLGLREALRKMKCREETAPDAAGVKEEENSSV